jgi:hypothetical protein
MAMRSKPLAGVQILDLTRLLPGPMCTLQLADMGADVIKIEDAEVGDYAREAYGGMEDHRALIFCAPIAISAGYSSTLSSLRAHRSFWIWLPAPMSSWRAFGRVSWIAWVLATMSCSRLTPKLSIVRSRVMVKVGRIASERVTI